MKFHFLFAALLAIMLNSIPAGANVTDAPAAASPPAGAVTAYQIAPDDVLSITVVNAPAQSVPQVIVLQDGTISVPFFPTPVKVAGKSPLQVTQDMTRKLSEWLIKPAVTVSVIARHRDHVYVYGYVSHPQSVDMPSALHVLDALAEAGDALPSGDLSQTLLTHSDGTQQTLDLSPSAIRAGTVVNPLLRPGDTVSVPEQRAEFSVLGQVGQPGSYPYKTDMTVLNALTIAGKVNMDDADLKSATLTHNGQVTPLDLDAMLHKADFSKNMKISAGDEINIPKAPRTYVYGAVQKSGFYSFTPGDHVLDALNASSVTPFANYTKVHVVHVDKLKQVATVQQINMEDYFKKGDLSANPLLQAGDAVYIETKGEPKRPWYDALQPIGIIASATRLLL